MTIEIRAARLDQDLTHTDDEARTFDALAVPWDTWTELAPGIREQFKRGALHPSPLGVKLRLEHAETIGVISNIVDTDEGLKIRGRISKTRAGDDAYTLARDGALTAVSIGFTPDPEGTNITDRDGTTDIVRTNAELVEVSLVSFPAYKTATVDQVRHRKENPHMTEKTSELDEVRASITEIQRSIAVLSDNTHAPDRDYMAYRNAGEYIKAAAAGDDLAKRFSDLDITTDATAPRPAWVERTLALMDAKMTLTNTFEHSRNLPAQGLSIEYPVIKANTIKVTEQAAEGDELARGKLDVENRTGDIKTYGGYTVVSRQTIERASASYLATVHRAQAIEYANAIEHATVKTLESVITENLKTPKITATAKSITAEHVAEWVIDLSAYFDENIIYPLDGILVSTDMFKTLATMDEIPKALQFTGAPDDKVGTLTLTRPNGTLAGLPVHRVTSTSLPANLFAGYSSQAIEILEGGGAPLRLSQEDVTNLTQAFSVYGYAAHLATAPDAIVPVKMADGEE